MGEEEREERERGKGKGREIRTPLRIGLVTGLQEINACTVKLLSLAVRCQSVQKFSINSHIQHSLIAGSRK